MFHRIPLPYALNHFEKILSSKLMDLHYNFHHKAYETALKIALENQNLNHIVDLEDLMSRYLSIFPSDLHSSIRFFGGGLLNHNIFFSILEKDKPLKEGALKSAIIKKFSSFEKFIDALLNAAVNLKIDNNVFGSGGVGLVLNQENELHLYLTANQDNPLQFNLRPVLGIDMGEHAYYLDYFNNKKQYVEKLLTILNGEAIEQRFNHYIGIN